MVEEQVSQLEVSVYYFVLVKITYSIELFGKSAVRQQEWNGRTHHHLKHITTGLRFCEALLTLHELEHGLICAELHDDVHILLILKHVFESHHMLVAQRLVNLNLRLQLKQIECQPDISPMPFNTCGSKTIKQTSTIEG